MLSKTEDKIKGFTLIELLIVVAIIAILAAIAVPNFLEAQVRAKVSRAKADQRTIATGLEAYAVDWNGYPSGRIRGFGDQVRSLWPLTTPVAYLTTANLVDPFVAKGAFSHSNVHQYLYFCYAEYSRWAVTVTGNNGNFKSWGYHMGWCVTSPGPDRNLNGGEWYAPQYAWHGGRDRGAATNRLYDSTNGTVSRGDIEAVRVNIGRVGTIARWGSLAAVISLALSIGFMGGRRWAGRLLWAAGSLLIVSAFWFATTGPVYAQLLQPRIHDALVDATESWPDSIDAASESFVQKVETIADSAVGGLSARSLQVLAVSFALTAAAIGWMYSTRRDGDAQWVAQASASDEGTAD